MLLLPCPEFIVSIVSLPNGSEIVFSFDSLFFSLVFVFNKISLSEVTFVLAFLGGKISSFFFSSSNWLIIFVLDNLTNLEYALFSCIGLSYIFLLSFKYSSLSNSKLKNFF